MKRPSLLALLKKADLSLQKANMFKGGADQPYRQRFVFNQRQRALTMDKTDYDKIITHEQSDGYFHHVGYKDNHKYHIYSPYKDPAKPGLAGIITAQIGDKQYMRAEMTNSMLPIYLNKLKTILQNNPIFKYSDEPIVLDRGKHAEKGWEDYHADLFHGIAPDVAVWSPQRETVTNWISFAAFPGEQTPRVVTKEALPLSALCDSLQVPKSNDFKPTADRSFFEHPRFTSAHREAAYHRLADQVFELGQYVPRTTVFRHPATKKPWSAAEFIVGARHITNPATDKSIRKLEENGDIYKLAIMNMILGNNDRHKNNYMKDHFDKFYLIDHGLSFDYNHLTNEIPYYIRHLFDKPVPESVHQWLWNIDMTKMARMMSEMGAPHEIITTAVGRLADARAWSNLVKYGSRTYKNNFQESHRGLAPLYEIIRARQYRFSPKDRFQIQSNVRKKILAGMKMAIDLSQKATSKASTIKVQDESKTKNKDMPLTSDI